MFHPTRKSLIISLLCTVPLAAFPGFSGNLAAQSQENSAAYTKYFDPKKGFKPAQMSLEDVWLQIAASMEHYGSPVPYFHHMQAEHQRVEVAFTEEFGATLRSYRPPHQTDEYIDKLSENWDKLEPIIGLSNLAKKSGKTIRLAINGEDGNGTVLLLILRHYSVLAREEMLRDKTREVDFEDLQEELSRVLSEREIPFLVERESELQEAEKKKFRALLEKPRFTKSDFPAMEEFYADSGPYDRLSEYGKNMLSIRTWAGTRPATETPPIDSDGRKYALIFWEDMRNVFRKIDSAAPPEQATAVKTYLKSLMKDIGMMAHSESMIASIEERVNYYKVHQPK